MGILDFISELVQNSSNGYTHYADNDGINFTLSKKDLDRLRGGKANDLLIHQHVALRMLLEQNEANEIPNGFIIPPAAATALDEANRLLLGLPEVWDGEIVADIRGNTYSDSFGISITATGASGKDTAGFDLDGPIISFSENELYLLTTPQLHVFTAVAKHAESSRSEFDNLQLILSIQDAQSKGAKVNIGAFESLALKTPDSVTVQAELDDDGRLILTPHFGQDASNEELQRVLGQLRAKSVASLRVGDEVIVLDEERLKAVNEILRNRVIPRDKVSEFLKNPTAFIDAALVNLDVGFSARVKGATQFKHAYFGETEESGIDWFGESLASETILPVAQLEKTIKDAQQLEEVTSRINEAWSTNADIVTYDDTSYDISDKELVSSILDRIKAKVERDDQERKPGDGEPREPEPEPIDTGPLVLDIELNDELAEPSEALSASIADALIDEGQLDWSAYSRLPLPHQLIGVRWILGMSESPNTLGGALLADDMGLGKTYMALAAVEHRYRWAKATSQPLKPVLVVAPLSLLENWKNEVGLTFKHSPFRDIVVLQADGDLRRFRIGGNETSQAYDLTDSEATINYSLSIGDGAEPNRLDIPARLVLTTYQTLRDYQFSLCSIDWGMVIFDEAQNIKNPNALQTRAAKGIKADFRLIATGTPVENSLAEFWCLMDTACPSYLASYQEFRAEFITPIVRAASDEKDMVRGTIGRNLRERVGALMLRRVKEDNLKGLPTKTVYVGIEDDRMVYDPKLGTELAGRQLETYDQVLETNTNSDTNTALTTLQRLRDVSLHPGLLLGGTITVSSKRKAAKQQMLESSRFDSLLSTLDDIQRRKEKCIIFVVNKRLQSFLSVSLSTYYEMPPISIINGDTKAVAKNPSSATRLSIISDFEKVNGFNLIIMSPVAAGVGLTITGANNVIHFERHWNPAKEAQATDRVYRIGQQKKVNVYIPIVLHPLYDSFDANLHRLLSNKSLLKDAVIAQEQVMPSPGGMTGSGRDTSKALSIEDVKQISWEYFEALCAELMQRETNANSSQLTAKGADYGADAVVMGNEGNLLIQCKHTTTTLYESYKAVQEVSGAEIKYEAELGKRFDRLIFMTNSMKLGPKTRALAKQYDVEIIDGAALKGLLATHSVSLNDILNRFDKARLKI